VKMKCIGIIPARLLSTRIAEKVIHPILGKPMIQYVYCEAKKSTRLDDLIVATDSDKVFNICESLSIPAIITSTHHQSGTERIIEVMNKIQGDIYINIQGDEPLVKGEMLDQLIEPLLESKTFMITTLKKRIEKADEIISPHVVKVVTNIDDEALYFSRSPIPFSEKIEEGIYYKHIGLYAYPREVLMKISELSPTQMEKTEKLEQLRFLEHHIKIKVIETDYDTISVDTYNDIIRVEQRLKGVLDEVYIYICNRGGLFFSG